ncbi:MAG TPA: glycosyltransferase family 2 protein [Solirubrobacterales bacterium]|nr:glycosyltransferase family 2 protein [Solirubrobacterales bacterium]
MNERLDLSYVVPIRWRDGEQREELAGYLATIAADCAEVIVVDGSAPEVFAANAAAFGEGVTHLPPDEGEECLMGKVSGVRTGVRLAACERVVLADDDVRYEPEALRRAARLLDEHDLVRPQNYFSELPWHARWDTARTLLNRSLGRDYPGTLAVRRSRMLAMGLYDGDVLFENLELIRTVRAHGGSSVAPLDLYVARVPPSASHFWGQRIRQAYDDFALPARMALWLALLPALALARRFGRPGGDKTALPAGAAGVAIALAEVGRRRAGGARVFPATSSLLAPLWVLERAVCAWLAVLQRLRFGGVRYGDSVIPLAAHSERQLRRRLQAQAEVVDRAGSEGGWSLNGARPRTSTESKTPASTGTWSRQSRA